MDGFGLARFGHQSTDSVDDWLINMYMKGGGGKNHYAVQWVTEDWFDRLGRRFSGSLRPWGVVESEANVATEILSLQLQTCFSVARFCLQLKLSRRPADMTPSAPIIRCYLPMTPSPPLTESTLSTQHCVTCRWHPPLHSVRPAQHPVPCHLPMTN